MNNTTTSLRHSRRQRRRSRRDAGSILPMALVMTVVLSVVVIGLANYTITNINFGQVVENRADRLSAAEAGLRHMLEQEQEASSLCTTAAGTGDGTTFTLPGEISGATVEVNCYQADSDLSAITAWAVVVTGVGIPAGDRGLITSGAGSSPKTFGGPSYIASTDLLGLDKPLEVREGNLWYTDPTCDAGGEYAGNGSDIANLSFSPASRGLWCTSNDWTDLFPEPTIGSVDMTVTNPPYEDIAGCRVFQPGYYTSPPEFGKNSVYMKSGNYLFDNAGTIVVDNKARVTFGRFGVGGGQQEIDNPDCNDQRDADSPEGATIYLGGNSRFEVGSNGAIEILRRQQGSDFVSIQALPEGHPMASTLDYTQNVITTGPGSNKQMVLQGMVWAPRAAVEFGNVSNDAAAQLSGGAVVARIEAQAAASASAFIIQVQGSDQSARLVYTATATKNGTTSVRVVAEVRFAPPDEGTGVGTWDVATNSWRVCGTTC